jgi:Fe-S oxidoreductase
MFSLIEKLILFVFLSFSIILTLKWIRHFKILIQHGKGVLHKPTTSSILKTVFLDLILLKPTWRKRFITNLSHLLIVWGFLFYLFVNFFDILTLFFPNLVIQGLTGNLFRLFADVFSGFILLAISYFILRRWIWKSPALKIRPEIPLHNAAKTGIKRDSILVASLIFLHVGSRLISESLRLVQNTDPWQPLASSLSIIWGFSVFPPGLWHLFTWLTILTILVFIPYFPFSKHIHLIFAPLNFIFKPERKTITELEHLDLEDETLEIFGANQFDQLPKTAFLDAYACIMCMRCQEVCPPYQAGSLLSPAALEINKRYVLQNYFNKPETLGLNPEFLTVQVIPEEAVWACTACGACTDICPVNNEPLRDILEIRRHLTLTQNEFPKPFEILYKNLERQTNPWGLPQKDRLRWTDGLNVPTVEDNPTPDYLWWVGCAGAYDNRAQKTSVAMAKILNHSQVSYAVLGELESCTGDSARRTGREDIFYEMALNNLEVLSQFPTAKIITTCPHCYHTLKNEYAEFGTNLDVIHHTELIQQFVRENKLTLNSPSSSPVTYHDPCYLGRVNQVFDPPREILQQSGLTLNELSQNKANTFCCGAGGGQMWKESEPSQNQVNHIRYQQALYTQAACLATACPFCKTMLADAAASHKQQIPVLDIAELIFSQIEKEPI